MILFLCSLGRTVAPTGPFFPSCLPGTLLNTATYAQALSHVASLKGEFGSAGWEPGDSRPTCCLYELMLVPGLVQLLLSCQSRQEFLIWVPRGLGLGGCLRIIASDGACLRGACFKSECFVLIDPPGHILGEAWEGQSPQLTGLLRPFVRPSVEPATCCPRISSCLRLSLSELLSFQWLLLSEDGSPSGCSVRSRERNPCGLSLGNFWAPPAEPKPPPPAMGQAAVHQEQGWAQRGWGVRVNVPPRPRLSQGSGRWGCWGNSRFFLITGVRQPHPLRYPSWFFVRLWGMKEGMMEPPWSVLKGEKGILG